MTVRALPDGTAGLIDASGRSPTLVLIDRVVAVFTSYRRHRHLILQLARRDFVGRYRGSLGPTSSRLDSLLMLAVYSFLLGVVLRSRRVTVAAGAPWQYGVRPAPSRAWTAGRGVALNGVSLVARPPA